MPTGAAGLRGGALVLLIALVVVGRALPAEEGVKLTAKVQGYTQGTEFNPMKYPFSYTGTSRLDAAQVAALAKPGEVPAATAEALLGCLLWPAKGDKLQKAKLKGDGKKFTGAVEVVHKYGKQGTHVLTVNVEGTVEKGRLTLQATRTVVSGMWDWGGGSIKLKGEVKVAFEVR